jgi:hypothetical protein
MTLHSIFQTSFFLLIHSVLFSVQYTFAQCAAVNTHSSEIRVPENKKSFFVKTYSYYHYQPLFIQRIIAEYTLYCI